MNELRIEIRLKNNILYESIMSVFGNVSEFCRKSGLSESIVGEFINLKKSPFSSNPCNQSAFKPIAKKLSMICGYSCEDLFPADLYKKITSEKIVRTMDLNKLLEYEDRRRIAKGIEYEAVDSNKFLIENSVKNAINTLSEREKLCISERYGIGDGIAKTLDDVAIKLRVTRERVRQIEEKAIRKLRHPSRGLKP